MAKNFYKALELEKNATDEDIKKAYRKLAMKWHPDKNPDNRSEAEAKFKEVTEAYETLGDPKKKEAFDRKGEEGATGRAQQYRAHNVPRRTRSSSFTSAQDSDTFSQFFERSFDGMRRDSYNGSFSARGPRPNERPYAETSSNVPPRQPRKASAIEQSLRVTLLELYTGATKKMKIKRTVYDVGGKKGTKITFEKKGDERPGVIPADIVFTVEEKKHEVFEREGPDLFLTQNVTLVQALCGCSFPVTTIDGRSIRVDIPEIIKPDFVKIIPGEGMPSHKDPMQKGDLKIKFNIIFPSDISTQKKEELKRILT
eukprot:gene13963-16505_t